MNKTLYFISLLRSIELTPLKYVCSDELLRFNNVNTPFNFKSFSNRFNTCTAFSNCYDNRSKSSFNISFALAEKRFCRCRGNMNNDIVQHEVASPCRWRVRYVGTIMSASFFFR